MEQELLRALYERYAREIYLYLLSLTRNPDVAADLMQEVFLKALVSYLDQGDNLRAWLYKVARNACFNELRREKRTEPLDGEEEKLTAKGTPLEYLIEEEKKRALYRAMEVLPVREREILELYYFSEWNFQRIAAFLRLSPEHVRVLASRARRTLKKELEAKGYEL